MPSLAALTSALQHGYSRRDPRLYQIAVLSLLLAAGITSLNFNAPLDCIATILGSALATQYAFTRLTGLPAFDPKSALISAISLCILLRTGSLWIAALAAFIAIASKFLIRVNGKHVFNPTNIAIAVLVYAGMAWISPAQWGSTVWFAFLFACLGMLVVTRAARADVTLAFLACYVGLVFARALWLGDPMEIPMKQLRSGALLLFAFFMISDPKTTPDARAARLVFAAAVAALAFTFQYALYIPQGLIYALALMAPLTVVLDRLCPATQYRWNSSPSMT